MPGAKDIARKEGGEIDSIEASRFGTVVCRGPSHQHLGQEKQGDDDKILDRGPLAFGGYPGKHLEDGCVRLFFSIPRKSNLPKEKRTMAVPARRVMRLNALQRMASLVGCIADRWIVRKIIGVRIGFARTIRYRGPGCPCKEGSELLKFSSDP